MGRPEVPTSRLFNRKQYSNRHGRAQEMRRTKLPVRRRPLPVNPTSDPTRTGGPIAEAHNETKGKRPRPPTQLSPNAGLPAGGFRQRSFVVDWQLPEKEAR